MRECVRARVGVCACVCVSARVRVCMFVSVDLNPNSSILGSRYPGCPHAAGPIPYMSGGMVCMSR